jgi:hypothetical protein
MPHLDKHVPPNSLVCAFFSFIVSSLSTSTHLPISWIKHLILRITCFLSVLRVTYSVPGSSSPFSRAHLWDLLTQPGRFCKVCSTAMAMAILIPSSLSPFSRSQNSAHFYKSPHDKWMRVSTLTSAILHPSISTISSSACANTHISQPSYQLAAGP